MAVESTNSVIVSTMHFPNVSVAILYRIDFETGAASEMSFAEIETARFIVLARGFTAATGARGPAAEIPANTTPSLWVLAVALTMRRHRSARRTGIDLVRCSCLTFATVAAAAAW